MISFLVSKYITECLGNLVVEHNLGSFSPAYNDFELIRLPITKFS